MYLVLFAAIFGLASSSPALGSRQCSWGPKYWCANIPQASECGAVKHCIKAVWTKQNVPVDDDEVCKICKDMVGQARDTLLSNETQEELKEVFDGSCDLIPIKIIAKECKAISDEFIPELVETLASEMNPDQVCTVSGLCNSARIDKMIEEQKNKMQFGGDCNICREGAREVKRKLSTMTPEDVSEKLNGLCGYMGSFSTACMQTVKEQSAEIYQMLTDHFSEEICDLSGLCSQAFEKVPATPLREGEDIECEFCEKVIQHWIDVYASDTSLNEFKQLLDGICDKLDSKNADHCKHIVDDYYIPAFEFIRTQLKPHMLCSVVGLCPSSKHTSKPQTISMVKLSPARKSSSAPSPGALNGPLYVPDSVVAANTPTCVMCEYVIDSLDKYISDKKNEAEVKRAVESICNRMPSSVKNKCTNFVETYEPAIVQMIVNNIDSSQICTMLHLCNSEYGDVETQALLQQNTIMKSLGKSSNCEMCEFAMNEVFSFLKDKDDQEMVKNVLESVCYHLPSSVERNCEDFVEKYTTTIVQLIVEGLSADEICSFLQLCEAEEVTTPVPVTPYPTADTSCVLCEYVITTLDSMLEDKSNEAQIKAALESLCSILPSSVEKQCDTFVETYTDLIIDMLTKDVSPEMICTNLGLCKKTSNIVEHHQVMTQVRVMQTSPYCTLCKMVIDDLDQMLEDKTNEAQIESALSVVCYQLSDPVHKQCEKLVHKYTEKIINMFVQQYTPDMICAELSMCVNNEINTNSIHEVDFDDRVEVHESIGCEMCEFAVSIIDQHLTDDSTIEQVERVVQFMCSYLPGTIADKCEIFVDEYGQKIIDAIVHDEMKPGQICAQLLPQCAKAPTPQIGEKRCIWGPSYWCATPFHALSCGTTEICKKTAWKELSVNNL